MPYMPKPLVTFLNQEEPGKEHDDLLRKVKDLVKLSRDVMAGNYAKWDKFDAAYRTEREADEADKKAAEKKEPTKMTLPMTLSQIQTFVAFCYQVFTQRPTFYELSGTGAEDIQAAKIAEWVLEYNLNHNKFKGDKLQQWLLDIARFGLGIFKHSWETKTVKVDQPVAMQMGQVPGVSVMPPMTTQLVDKIAYQGNKVVVVSPYRFFPDPRVPLTRFQEGEFCASEDEYSEISLKKLEKEGCIAGMQYVKPMTSEMLTETDRRVSFSGSLRNAAEVTSNTQKYYIVTEVQLDLVPSEWTINSVPLGTSDAPEKYLIWYVNDQRIVRIEPMGYLHQEFTYDLAQFSNDQIRFINMGLSEILEQLQDVQNWFINSRITNVRQIIGNKLLVDPKGVEMQDLKDRSPVIRLKGTVQGSGVDRWVKQLTLQDVTTNHVQDAKLMGDFAKDATGITENLLGQFASGRRSATEARNVNNSAAARLLLVASSLWELCLEPLGRHMLSNLRDGMDVAQLVPIIGETNAMANQQGIAQFFKADKSSLVGDYDFLVFDGTLPSQRGEIANVLQELLIQLVQNPEMCFVFGFDPRPLLREVLTLRGIRNLEQFQLTPDAAQQLVQLVGLARNASATAGAGGPSAGPAGNRPGPSA